MKKTKSPTEIKADLRHDAQLWAEQYGDEACSLKQAQFVASLFQACFEGTSTEKEQAYRTCLDYLWGCDSAKDLTKSEAHETIDWLREEDAPNELSSDSAKEAKMIHKEALKERGQQEMKLE